MNKHLITTLLSTAFLSTSLQAQVLMLDFGPTSASSAGDLINSPGHASGAIAGSLTKWNTLATVDNESTPLSFGSLSFADNTAATGVTVNLGTESGVNSGTLSFLSRPTRSSNLGSGTNGTNPDFSNSTLFGSAVGPVGRDGIFGGTNLANGMRIDGLSAGSYEVYFVGWNTNENEVGAQMNVYSSAAASSDTFAFGLLTADTSVITNTSVWTEGSNFVKSLVTLAAGQSLYLANDSTGLTNNRGFINSVQVVLVPEVSNILVGGLLGLGLFRRRRIA